MSNQEPQEFVPVSLAPDPIIEAYKKDIDRTLLRENLARSVEERWLNFESLQRFIDGLRGVARSSKESR